MVSVRQCCIVCDIIVIQSLMMEGQKKIEKYQFSLKRQLGQGSYATVYLGKEIDSQEPVAVKVIDKKIFSNAYNVKNIQSEIDIMKKVSHHNIVRLHDIYQTANNMYIVTELCPDGDLHRLLQKKRRLPEGEAKGYLRDIMSGIKYLHKNGIIHRDLKPANILLKQGCCRISDFGFAKSLSHDETIMKSIVGTPLYMSPQILKKAKYTTKSDLWSVGLIYYEMLHGRTPWPASNEIQLINGIYHKKLVFAADVSEKSKDFIKSCLEIYQEDRMTWEQAFGHKLLVEPIKKLIKPTLDFGKISCLQENKENCNASNKLNKTPSSKLKLEEQKSPLNRNKKDFLETLQKREEEFHNLTPKSRTPKGKFEKSDLKKVMTQKKDKKDTSTATIKKKGKVEGKGSDKGKEMDMDKERERVKVQP